MHWLIILFISDASLLPKYCITCNSMLKNGPFHLIDFVFSPENRNPKNRDSRTEFPGIPIPGKTRISREILVPGISRVQPYPGHQQRWFDRCLKF